MAWFSNTGWKDNYNKVPLPTNEDWKRIYSRFSTSEFVMQVRNDLVRNGNWDYQESQGGIAVGCASLRTKSKIYRYYDYGLTNLDQKSCWELACYLGSLLPAGKEFVIRTNFHVTLSGSECRDGFVIFEKGTGARTNLRSW